MKLNRQLVIARFLEVEFRFLRIIGALRQFICRRAVDVCRTDWVVIAQFTISKDNFFQPIFTVNDMFYRQTHVIVVKRRHGCDHGQGNLLVPRHSTYCDRPAPLQEVHGFKIHVVHAINGPCHQRVGPSCWIGNTKRFNFVKEAGVFFPVVRIALCEGTHTRIIVDEDISAGPVARLPVNCAVSV